MERGKNNQRDDYAVAVTKNGDIVGHARSISGVSWFFFLKREEVIAYQIVFLKRGGVITLSDCAHKLMTRP